MTILENNHADHNWFDRNQEILEEPKLKDSLMGRVKYVCQFILVLICFSTDKYWCQFNSYLLSS